MAIPKNPGNFQGPLAGFTPQARNLVLDLCNEDWTGRLSSKGHAIMRSPDGVTTLAISRSIKNDRAKQNVLAEIRRAKERHVEGMIWTPVGETSTILTNGEIYRCNVCSEEFDTPKQAVGHHIYAHTKILDRTGKPSYSRKKKPAEPTPEVIEETPRLSLETQEVKAQEVEVKQETLPLTETQAGAVETLTAWLEAFPGNAAKEIIDMNSEITRLRADNQRLREGLKTLADLAKDV